jgi:hypothetical protein
MSPPIISSCSWLSLTKLSSCHKNAAVAANSGILKHPGEIFRPTCCCEGLIMNLSRDNFCPALATPLESRTVRRTVRSTVRSCVRPDPTTDSSTDTGHNSGPSGGRSAGRPYRVNTVLRTAVDAGCRCQLNELMPAVCLNEADHYLYSSSSQNESSCHWLNLAETVEVS